MTAAVGYELFNLNVDTVKSVLCRSDDRAINGAQKGLETRHASFFTNTPVSGSNIVCAAVHIGSSSANTIAIVVLVLNGSRRVN